MANITASLVKELREKTGAGMMDCKKALTETNGEIEEAVDWLRKAGLSAAAKKSGRVAAEGLVGTAVDGTKGAMVEINAETDGRVIAIGVERGERLDEGQESSDWTNAIVTRASPRQRLRSSSGNWNSRRAASCRTKATCPRRSCRKPPRCSKRQGPNSPGPGSMSLT